MNHVNLPPWAKGSPEIFIAKQREALECPYVSNHLHKWIDLIFGHKQKGQPAFEAVNIFHPWSYAGAVDLDTIENQRDRQTMVNVIDSFGQTPLQIFDKPHPARDEVAHRFTSLNNAADGLIGPTLVSEMRNRVAKMSWSEKQERLICSGPFRLHVPPNYDKYVEWGFVDGSLRFFSLDGKRLAMFEHLHIGPPSTAMFVDSRSLVTAGADCVVSIWNVEYAHKHVGVVLRTALFGHRHPITALASSSRFMALLTSDTSGRVLMWDLNRNDFVRELQTKGPEVKMAGISNETGDVLLARGRNLKIVTLNGTVLLEENICDDADDEVLCLAWVEALKQEWMAKILFVTGHKAGLVKVWQRIIRRDGKWALRLVRSLDVPLGPEASRMAVTSVLPVGPMIYAGDELGRIVSFRC